MPISPYFAKPKTLDADQILHESLINEQIYLRGINVYYILRESMSNIDMIFGEDPSSIFQNAYLLAALPLDTENWASGDSMFSKFGLIMNKSTEIAIARREFKNFVLGRDKPAEGDLIYIPTMEKLFEIKKSNYEDSFFVYGKPETYYWKLSIEMFKYSHENITTGVEEIDLIEPENAYVIEFNMEGGSINYWTNELVSQGNTTAIVKSWDSENNILSVYNINGEFTKNVAVIGATSNAHWTITDYDDLQNNEETRLYINQDVQTTTNTSIVNVETNPFGSI